MQKVDRTEPTAAELGNIEYWNCLNCGKYFADVGLTKAIEKGKNVLAPASMTPSSPQTGDNSNMALWFALMGVGATGLVGVNLLRKRQKDKTKSPESARQKYNEKALTEFSQIS